MSIADAMASNGMKEAGYEYINMDGERRGTGKATVILTVPVYHDSIDCWADHRDADGTIVPDESRFPK